MALAATSLTLTTIIIVLSQGQGDKDLKGKTKQVVVVPNGTHIRLIERQRDTKVPLPCSLSI